MKKEEMIEKIVMDLKENLYDSQKFIWHMVERGLNEKNKQELGRMLVLGK